MGKLSDALERHQKERAIKTKMLPVREHEPSILKEASAPTARESIIRHSFDPKLMAHSMPESIDAENFKTLKGQILFPKDRSRPRTILITSAFPSEGKTFVAANLAVSLAQGINEHALLVDCDFRRPRLHTMLGCSNKDGLQEYLTGKRELSELLIRPGIENLTLLTAGNPAPNPAELLSSNKVKALFEELKAHYQDRYVIIDTAPSHVISEVNILAKYVDGIIFVVRSGKAPKELIHKCIENLGKEKVLGIVFNGYEKAHKTYSRYYKNYYKKE